MTTVEALKALYTALGGEASDVANASTIVEVLNAIAAKYDGDDDAIINPDAIANIAAVAGNITPEPTLIEKSITANDTYNASDDNADGYSSVSVNVPAPTLTGFENMHLSDTTTLYVGYYNATPTHIEAVVSNNKPDNFTTLGILYFRPM